MLVTVGVAAASGALWGLGHLELGEAQAAALVMRTGAPDSDDARRGFRPAFESPWQWHGPLATGTFHGMLDRDLLAPLRSGKVERVKFNRGGSSISLRIDFDNGARAAFKPQQTNYQTIPRKEVAAYRVSRMLGLSSVQPAIGRSFDAEEIFARLDASAGRYVSRLRQEIISQGGSIVGELSWWIPVIKTASVGGFDIDSVEGMVTWKRMLKVGAEIPAEDRQVVEQLSTMLLFDFLINNPDRWSGGNAKVSEDGRTLYFMDNTMSFGAHPKAARRVRLYFQRAQTFSRSVVAKLRALDEDQVERALAEDTGPFEVLLTKDELEAMFSRRDIALSYIDELIAEHGEESVLAFP